MDAAAWRRGPLKGSPVTGLTREDEARDYQWELSGEEHKDAQGSCRVRTEPLYGQQCLGGMINFP